MEISRDFYLDKLIKRKHNGLIKVITGIHRCGKSYLLNNLFYHHLLNNGVNADHIIRFAFDSADDLYLIGESLIQIEKEKRGIDPEKFMAYIRSKVVDDGMYYLLLDEIQMLDCFEAVLNGYLRKDNMYPLSFAEFMNVYNGDKYMGLSEYMLYGVFLWLSFVKVQMIRRLHCRIYSMKSIFGILPGEIVLKILESWRIC